MTILISGKYPGVLLEPMEFSLKILSDWSKSSGLGVNSIKVNIALFTWNRIGWFRLPWSILELISTVSFRIDCKGSQ